MDPPLVIEKPATDKLADYGINLAQPADGGIDLVEKPGIGHQAFETGSTPPEPTPGKASRPGEQELPSLIMAARFKFQKVLLIGLGLAVLWTIARSNSDSIGRVPVLSSAMRSVGYSESRLVLEIEFTNGAVYQYYDVPKELHAGLMTAPSHGRYFNQQIRNAGFRYRRIE